MDIRPGSMGKPAPGYEVRVVDDDGHEVEVGQKGNLAIKSKVLDVNGNLVQHPGEAHQIGIRCFRVSAFILKYSSIANLDLASKLPLL